jgi:hypothetical protein
MTLLVIAIALVVLVLFFYFAGPNAWRPRFRRRWGPARFGRGPVTGRWGRRL